MAWHLTHVYVDARRNQVGPHQLDEGRQRSGVERSLVECLRVLVRVERTVACRTPLLRAPQLVQKLLVVGNAVDSLGLARDH